MSPFWKTWWFISLVALTLAAIFFFVVRYVSTRKLREQLLILEKEKAIETERARISRDMHDDLGSGLTKIAILSEVTQRQLQQPEKAEQQLHTISDSARTLIDNLSEIIWTLNPQHDNLDSLMAYIRDYATRYFDGMDVSAMFDYPSLIPQIHLTDQQRRSIFLVVKESLNNISKHAKATRVNIELKIKPNIFQILISDSGNGFDILNPRAGGNGLKNMSHRMHEVSGEYTITSVIGKGTITTLTIKT
jgi:signal transduction histidine kinase